MEELRAFIGEFKEFKRNIEARNEKSDAKIDRILEQTTKTNGRVKQLEDDQEYISDELQSVIGKMNTMQNSMSKNVGRDRVIGWIIGILATLAVAAVLGMANAYIENIRLHQTNNKTIDK